MYRLGCVVRAAGRFGVDPKRFGSSRQSTDRNVCLSGSPVEVDRHVVCRAGCGGSFVELIALGVAPVVFFSVCHLELVLG